MIKAFKLDKVFRLQPFRDWFEAMITGMAPLTLKVQNVCRYSVFTSFRAITIGQGLLQG